MAGQIFRRLYKNAEKAPETVADVDKIIEASGKTIDVRYIHRDISCSRGSVFKVKDLDADEIFDRALKR